MPGEELTAWARCVLNDFDARTPWRSFTPPQGMTSERAYALQGEVARLRENRGEGVHRLQDRLHQPGDPGAVRHS